MTIKKTQSNNWQTSKWVKNEIIKNTQSKKKAEKEEGSKEYMVQTENRYQKDGFKSSCIDNYIKCEWSKYPY